MAPRSRKPVPDDFDVATGMPEAVPSGSGGVEIRKLPSGHALISPAAISKRLTPAAREAAAMVQAAANQRDALLHVIETGVLKMRQEGASWASVAWYVGLTAQGAQSRFADLESPTA
jgi:hypothetical protein